jgi:hypothetical protein
MQLNEGKMSIVSDAVPEIHPASPQHAVLDDAQIGDINGAFGTIRRDDHGPRHNWRARASTLLAILGPGLIVMVGDNDAGAFGTYTQAGQNYGTSGSGPRDIPAGATRGRERISHGRLGGALTMHSGDGRTSQSNTVPFPPRSSIEPSQARRG